VSENAQAGLPPLVQRANGIYARALASPAALRAIVGQLFVSGACLRGVDYPVLMRLLYQAGPELPASLQGLPLIRCADAIAPFSAARHELYKSVKIVEGEAEYYFEAVFLAVDDAPPQPARLDFDEFVAAMWIKGIRFGIDAAAVKAAIAAGKVARAVVARKLEAMAPRDAAIVEVLPALQRSHAPRETADGRVDLQSLQNSHPQVRAQARLLKKVAGAPGLGGYELSGQAIAPAPPRDVDLAAVGGEGTAVVHDGGAEYLVALVDGYLNVETDGATGARRLSVSSKIVSRDGVSARTTGNLRLTAEYEEFGEVQEQRTVSGAGITIHGDVFGHIASRGGVITLHQNLVGGAAANADGDIHVLGVASGALLQTKRGDVVVARAESCVISGTRVVIADASNCEIFADEVEIDAAHGCAIAARRIVIGSAGPRKQAEMLLFPLVPDTTALDAQIEELDVRAEELGALAAERQAGIDAVTGAADVRNYLNLASRVRRRELVLKAEQLAVFEKMAEAVGPALKSVTRLTLALKQAQQDQAELTARAQALRVRRKGLLGHGSCTVRDVQGETLVRTMDYDPETGAQFDLSAKEIKARLRVAAAATSTPLPTLFNGSSGSVAWRAALDASPVPD